TARHVVATVIDPRFVLVFSQFTAPCPLVMKVQGTARKVRGCPGSSVAGTPASGERAPGTVSNGNVAKRLSGAAPASSANWTPPGNHPVNTTALMIVTTNGLAVNGTGMIRPGSGSDTVGGPARTVTGAISGSSFRPKHP